MLVTLLTAMEASLAADRVDQEGKRYAWVGLHIKSLESNLSVMWINNRKRCILGTRSDQHSCVLGSFNTAR